MGKEILLFQNNLSTEKRKIKFSKGMAVFTLKEEAFNYTALKKIIFFCNSLHEQYKKKIPISFEFGNIYFIDKLVYVIFECICNSLICDWGHDVYVKFNNRDDIWTAGVDSSPLLLLTTGEKRHLEKFKQKYKKEIFHHHYRTIVKGNEQDSSDFLCKLSDDIEYFLKTFSVQKEYRDEISEVIVELIGNAGEHTQSDCLIDLDVSPGYRKKQDDYNYYGINLAIVNFSEKLLGDGIKAKVSLVNNLDERHDLVRQAYEVHKSLFSEKYTEEDFFHIASFQHRISERNDSEYTGGTGLTKLIKSLEFTSDAHRCYVLSGNRGLIFWSKYLEYNSENWIGFNDENNFLTKAPDFRNMEQSVIFLPGTAYNLNFVMKGEKHE